MDAFVPHNGDMDIDERAPNEIVDLLLAGFDTHGTTRGRYRGQWVEVEHGIPGESVQAEILGGRRPRGRIREITAPSPDRVEPPCEYFRDWQCGGCQWQHIEYPGQIERKVTAVNQVMQAADLPLSVSAVHTLDDPWRYRSTAGISLGKRAGFRRHGSLAIVPIRDCPISHPLIGALMATLNDRIDEGLLPDFRGRVRLEVRVAGQDGKERIQVLVRVDPDKAPDPDAIQELLRTLSAIPVVDGVSLTRPGRPLETVTPPLFAPTPVAGQDIDLAAASFFQTNLKLLPRLIERIREETQPLDGKVVADVYGGVGIFGLFLAAEAKKVIEIESDGLAIEAGRRTAKRWGVTNVDFRQGEAEDLLSAAGALDVIIVDPPRSGLTEEVRAALMTGKPALILYVSCLAQSLARDLSELKEAGYFVQDLELFDFYPQTYHVELLAVLRRP